MTDSFSVEDAVRDMSGPEPEDTAPDVAAETPDQTPDNDIEAQPEAESDDGAETPTEVEDGETPEPETVIEAPHFWSAERKADFANLPADLQQYVLENDKQAQRTVSQKLEEAATARKAADAEMEGLKTLAGRISEAAERAEETFGDRWGAVTAEQWVQLAKEDPARYTQLKAQHDAEREAVQQAKTAKDAATQLQRAQWVASEEDRLKTLAPELADPVKGPANRSAVAAYLQTQGVSEQDLPNVGALEVSIAWKAMQYDKGLSALKARPAAEKAPVRPAASSSQSPQSSALAKADTRFKQTGSVEDAVRLLNLKG